MKVRFKDTQTGNTLTTANAWNIAQYRKNPERFEEIKGAEPVQDPQGSGSESEDSLEGMTLDELREYAAKNNIKLGNATTRATILEIIAKAAAPKKEDGNSDGDNGTGAANG